MTKSLPKPLHRKELHVSVIDVSVIDVVVIGVSVIVRGQPCSWLRGRPVLSRCVLQGLDDTNLDARHRTSATAFEKADRVVRPAASRRLAQVVDILQGSTGAVS